MTRVTGIQQYSFSPFGLMLLPPVSVFNHANLPESCNPIRALLALSPTFMLSLVFPPFTSVYQSSPCNQFCFFSHLYRFCLYFSLFLPPQFPPPCTPTAVSAHPISRGPLFLSSQRRLILLLVFAKPRQPSRPFPRNFPAPGEEIRLGGFDAVVQVCSFVVQSVLPFFFIP